MTPLAKWVRDRLEKVLGRYAEGEEAPKRLREQVISFANFFPKATRAQWVEFAASFAEQCYEAGYIRGVEWVERGPSALASDPTPEEIADQIDPTWRDRPWRPDQVLEGDANAAAPEERTPMDVLKERMAAMKFDTRRF